MFEKKNVQTFAMIVGAFVVGGLITAAIQKQLDKSSSVTLSAK